VEPSARRCPLELPSPSGNSIAPVSQALRLLTAVIGALLIGCAFALAGYALISGKSLTDLGWVALIALASVGVLLLRRAAKWGEPRSCPRCGTQSSRNLPTCPRCGYDFSAPTWAAIGKLELP
jgi:hypothetical protein